MSQANIDIYRENFPPDITVKVFIWSETSFALTPNMEQERLITVQ